jgi:hypothetical protein
MKNTKDRFPLDPKVNWWRLPEEVAVLAKKVNDIEVGGVSGSPQDLQEVTDEGNSTTNNIQLLDTAKILFDNGSRIQKGTTNGLNGGNGGVSQVCSIDYELKWEAGRQYLLGQDGFTIREVNHTFTFTPDLYEDETKGFVPGSRWVLDNGDVYICVDSTAENAVWQQVAPKYKVFTALLTQYGGSNSLNLLSQNAPNLVVGVTYQIQDDGGSGWDFTNVGAPSNDLFTSFIATGTVPNSWGTNAMLTYNEGAPIVAVVLENTIGNIWFTYESVGRYAMESDGLFRLQNTATFNSTFYSFNTEGVVTLSTPSWEANTDNKITLTTAIVGNGPLSLNDSLMTTPVLLEVRVYN